MGVLHLSPDLSLTGARTMAGPFKIAVTPFSIPKLIPMVAGECLSRPKKKRKIGSHKSLDRLGALAYNARIVKHTQGDST